MRIRVAVALVALGVALGCGGSQVRSEAPKGSGVILFDSSVKDAAVWVDGRHLPGAITRGVELPVGPHRIEIRHERYHTVYFEVTLARGDKKTLEVRPAKILP